jgi:hypothetical protein
MGTGFSLMPMHVPWNFEIAGMANHDALLLECDNMRVRPAPSQQCAYLRFKDIVDASGHLDFNGFGLGFL